MEARLLYGGGGEIHLTAAADYSAGQILSPTVVGGGVCGVVAGSAPIKTGDRFTVLTKGVFDVDSASATTVTKGNVTEWDDSGNKAVASSGTFTLGRAVLAKTSGQLVVKVNLNEFGDEPDT